MFFFFHNVDVCKIKEKVSREVDSLSPCLNHWYIPGIFFHPKIVSVEEIGVRGCPSATKHIGSHGTYLEMA